MPIPNLPLGSSISIQKLVLLLLVLSERLIEISCCWLIAQKATAARSVPGQSQEMEQTPNPPQGWQMPSYLNHQPAAS